MEAEISNNHGYIVKAIVDYDRPNFVPVRKFVSQTDAIEIHNWVQGEKDKKRVLRMTKTRGKPKKITSWDLGQPTISNI